ncbi:unnamed protein product [Arctia plantaginis]|uniref:Glutathione S-transferase n=1 Tax=Arctia plantaginis TaxID=874455 RepID=A0A8S0YP48_ARCPL|nr:unnamed protein product [Arctia plantaginis]
MAPILYRIDASSPANAVRTLADMIRVELELKDVNFLVNEHKSPEYLKINPAGTVPALIDDDFVVSDSHSIMKYLLSKYGGDKAESLYPSDLRTRTLVDQAMFYDTGVLFIRLTSITIPSIYGSLTEVSDKQKQDIENSYSVLEAYLQNRKYVAADHLTLGDLSVGATTNSLQPFHKLDSHKFPRTADWLSRMQQEPSFKKIMEPATKLLAQAISGFWQRNKQK